MQLYFHQIHQNKGIRLIQKTDIGIDMNEKITAMAVCPRGIWVVIATKLGEKLTNIVLFQILINDKSVEWQDEINYYLDRSANNWVREINVDLKV